MDLNVSFNKTKDKNLLLSFKEDWYRSLTSPPDGMWESFRSHSTDWSIACNNQLVGYATINENNQLLQFYITREYMSHGETIFNLFIRQHKIESGIVGTNNPQYLSLALNENTKVGVHTYLFRSFFPTTVQIKEGTINCCQPENLEKLVAFYHESTNGPTSWLKQYLSERIEKEEVYSLILNHTILGCFEVRKNDAFPQHADIGMVVSPNHRMKGLGSYLLNQAKTTAIGQGMTPICSCEKENVGSLKSIQKCGFVSHYQLLEVAFSLH